MIKRKLSRRRRNLLASLLIVAIFLVFGAWLLGHRNDDGAPTAKKSGNNAANVDTTSQPEGMPDTIVKTPEPNPDPDVPGGSTGENAGTGAGPATPSGAFVSNHKPSLSRPGRNQVSSACDTTEGATCVISFTKGGVTKSLESKKTDKNGSASWDWTLQQLGLSAGTWKIEAKATLNGKSKTATDTLDLEVQP